MTGKVIDDPSLSARLRARQQELAAARVEDMTVAERLTRRALLAPTVVIDLGDDDDPIPVEVRVPVSAELDVLLTLQSRFSAATTPEESAAITNEVADVLGELCVDPSLNAEFWRSGMFELSAMFAIILGAISEAMERVKQAESFRKTSVGKGAAPALRVSRKAAP